MTVITKYHTLDGLNTVFLQIWKLKLQGQVLISLGFRWGLYPWLLSLAVSKRTWESVLCMCAKREISGVFSYKGFFWIRAWSLWCHLTLITSLKTLPLNTVTLGVYLQHDFGGYTIQSIILLTNFNKLMKQHNKPVFIRNYITESEIMCFI